MISFGIKYWFIFLLLVIVGALAAVLVLYYKNKENKELTSWQIRLLTLLRFLSVLIISFLLLSPFIRNLRKITRNPVIITAWDNSSSLISTPDSVQTKENFNKVRAEIRDALGGEYSIIEYTFGEKTALSDEINFGEKKSDYSDLLNTVANNHFNENIGALIVAGDGIYNHGNNPANRIEDLNFPVYTIGFGDTTEVSDARIQNIRVNRTSFSGNKFPVEVDVQFLKVRGRRLKLSVLHKGVELENRMITPPNDNYFLTEEFILEAGEAGLKHFSVSIETVPNERNTKNNKAGFVINVLENKQKILILSDGPHPDIGALKNTLDLQQTYDVSVFTAEPYPADLSEFNLLILNQLPSRGKAAAGLIKNAETERIPILFIVGNKTFLPQLNVLNQGAKVLPLAGSGEQAQATLNPTYATFNLSSNFKEMIPGLPPLQVAFADYEMEPEFTSLLYQKIVNIETAKPLIATGNVNGRKTGFIFGEGIWRWRLYDYYTNQNHTNFSELINQLIQYLSLRENEDNFIVDFKPVYAEIEDIILNAEVYNDVFEKINSEEVNIELKNTNGDAFDFTFDIHGSNYILNAGHLPKGDYTFSAEVKIGNDVFNETGSFTIVPVNYENIISKANHNLLFRIAQQSGGSFYYPENIDKLITELKTGNKLAVTSYFQELIRELLNQKWLFFVVLLFLSMEWFLRKYWGIY